MSVMISRETGWAETRASKDGSPLGRVNALFWFVHIKASRTDLSL